MSGDVNSAYAARRFACEAFAQEPIHHQLGLNLGWCGLHDCAAPPSSLARNPAENFCRDWWVVDVADDRGAIRHDLFPKQSGLQRRPGSKDAIGLGVLTIGSKDIVLEYTVPMACCDAVVVLLRGNELEAASRRGQSEMVITTYLLHRLPFTTWRRIVGSSQRWLTWVL